MATRRTEVKTFIEDAERNDWYVSEHTAGSLLVCSPIIQYMEPQAIRLQLDGKFLAEGMKSHFTTIDIGQGTREYAISGGGAWRTVKNTYHPLRASRWFAHADVKQFSDKDLCAPHGIPKGRLMNPRIRGFFRWKDADFLSVKLLHMHPIEVWGVDAWVRTEKEKWA